MGTFHKYSPCTQWVKWGQIDGHFSKILGMCPVGIGWANCFRTHHELTMYPLGKCPLAPSVADLVSRCRSFYFWALLFDLPILSSLNDIPPCENTRRPCHGVCSAGGTPDRFRLFSPCHSFRLLFDPPIPIIADPDLPKDLRSPRSLLR